MINDLASLLLVSNHENGSKSFNVGEPIIHRYLEETILKLKKTNQRKRIKSFFS